MRYFLFRADIVFRPVRILGDESHRLRLFQQLTDMSAIMRCVMMCPVRNSENTVRNGSVRNGKPGFRCERCGGSFAEHPENIIISQETGDPADRPPPEKFLPREQRGLPESRSDGCKTVSVMNMRKFGKRSRSKINRKDI